MSTCLFRRWSFGGKSCMTHDQLLAASGFGSPRCRTLPQKKHTKTSAAEPKRSRGQNCKLPYLCSGECLVPSSAALSRGQFESKPVDPSVLAPSVRCAAWFAQPAFPNRMDEGQQPEQAIIFMPCLAPKLQSSTNALAGHRFPH